MADTTTTPTTTGGGGFPWDAAQTGLDFGVNLYNMFKGNQNATKGLDYATRVLGQARDARNNMQRGTSAQWAPYQTIGLGALPALAQMAGQQPGHTTAPQSRSLIPGMTTGAGADGSYTPPVNMGAMFDPTMMQSLLNQMPRPTTTPNPMTQEEQGGPQPGPQDSTGIRNATTGGRDGGLVVRPDEKAYVDNWLATNPGQDFTDADLHGIRNLNTAKSLGLSEAQWNGLTPQDQKHFLQGGLPQQIILNRLFGGRR